MKYDHQFESLYCFIPGLLLHRLANDPTPITKPTTSNYETAVLYADLASFTTISEQLTNASISQGLAGAEQITKLLNDYFSKLIDIIHQHGGDIVKFAGDAIMAIWPAHQNEDIETLLQRCAQCSLDIQQQLHHYQSTGDIQLSLKIGLGAGQLSVMYVGGALGRWEFIVTGDPILQVKEAENHASPGEVILSKHAWQLINKTAKGRPFKKGLFKLESMKNIDPQPFKCPQLSEQALQTLWGYIPGAIRSRLDAGQYEWLSELRRISTLFINLPDLTHHTPLAKTQAVMNTLQTTLYYYEGSVNKLSIDDKGISLVAALGLPPFAHEDDAERAVRAAIDIQTKLNKMNVRNAIGVSTGLAFCGMIGNYQRQEYTMIGNVINLAARLMQAAPGEILCDQATVDAIHSDLSFDKLPPIQLKGKQEPTIVFRPQEDRKIHLRFRRTRYPLVNRQREMGILKTALDQLIQHNRGTIIIIEGEAGIGKTRLMQAFMEMAWGKSAEIMLGAADSIHKTIPYYAWRAILSQVFDFEGIKSTEDKRQQILYQLELMEGLVPLTPLLNPILHLDFPENPLSKLMSSEETKENIHLLLISIFKQIATYSPKIMILEDISRLDEESWYLLQKVSQEVPQMLYILTTRSLDKLSTPIYCEFLTRPQTIHIDMAPLFPAETAQIIKQRLNVEKVDQSITKSIHERTHGNPFFIEQLTYSLKESNLIKIENDKCDALTSISKDFNFPDTAQAIVTSRIDRLKPPQQLTLKVASVIGRIFSFQVLQSIYPIETDKPNLIEHLEILKEFELISSLISLSDEVNFIFKHTTIQEVAYNLMSQAQRKELHTKIAKWLEENYSDELSSNYTKLQYHWNKAENHKKSRHYLNKLGKK